MPKKRSHPGNKLNYQWACKPLPSTTVLTTDLLCKSGDGSKCVTNYLTLLLWGSESGQCFLFDVLYPQTCVFISNPAILIAGIGGEGEFSQLSKFFLGTGCICPSVQGLAVTPPTGLALDGVTVPAPTPAPQMLQEEGAGSALHGSSLCCSHPADLGKGHVQGLSTALQLTLGSPHRAQHRENTRIKVWISLEISWTHKAVAEGEQFLQ